MKGEVYLDLYIILDVKNSSKATRVLKLIQELLALDLFVEELYKSAPNEFTTYGFIKIAMADPKILITDTLILLSNLGEKWLVSSPKLDYDEYWKFRGTRSEYPDKFKVNGIKSIDFELTDYSRERDDIDFILRGEN